MGLVLSAVMSGCSPAPGVPANEFLIPGSIGVASSGASTYFATVGAVWEATPDDRVVVLIPDTGEPREFADLDVTPDGDLLVYTFDATGTSIGRWDGESLRPIVEGGHLFYLARTDPVQPTDRSMMGFGVGPDGAIYVAGGSRHVVWRVEDGDLVRFAGTGSPGLPSASSNPLTVDISHPVDVAIGPDGTVYVLHIVQTDDDYLAVTRIRPDGEVSPLYVGEGDLVEPSIRMRYMHGVASSIASASDGLFVVTDFGLLQLSHDGEFLGLFGTGVTRKASAAGVPVEEMYLAGDSLVVGRSLDPAAVILGKSIVSILRLEGGVVYAIVQPGPLPGDS